MKKVVSGIFLGLVSIGLLAGCAEKEVVEEARTHSTLTQEAPGEFVYVIENQTDETHTYTFPSSMQIDYTLYKDGEKQYTHSEVVTVTQVVTERKIMPRSVYNYHIRLDHLAPGHYQLDVWFLANESTEDTKQTRSFHIE